MHLLFQKPDHIQLNYTFGRLSFGGVPGLFVPSTQTPNPFPRQKKHTLRRIQCRVDEAPRMRIHPKALTQPPGFRIIKKSLAGRDCGLN